MPEIAALRPKTYSYLKDDNNKNKNVKITTKCVVKRNLKFEDYKNCFEATQLENKINQLEKRTFNVDSLRENHSQGHKKQ